MNDHPLSRILKDMTTEIFVERLPGMDPVFGPWVSEGCAKPQASPPHLPRLETHWRGFMQQIADAAELGLAEMVEAPTNDLIAGAEIHVP